MAKKYIGLEDAAEFLGVQPDELVRIRETGKVRGFADRGTWKFKMDDLEELARRLQADSNPDVPIKPAAGSDDAALSSSVLGGEEDAVGEQSTTIRGSVDSDAALVEGTSDSDVRLILDDSLDAGGSEPDRPLPSDLDSDSDVQLLDDSSTTLDTGSDSDVALVGADSDTDPGSDSDVALVPAESDGSSVILGDDTDGSSILSEESGIELSAESGISLENLDDSGISLEADSGLTLAEDDSGLSVLDADSGLTLESDDSGISLDADSGITLADDLNLEDMDRTVSMPNVSSLASDDKETELEIPSLESDGDSEFELQLDDSALDSSGDSSVLLFDDEDEDPDEHSQTVVKKSGDFDSGEDETFDITEGDDDGFDLEEDDFGDDDDLDLSDDVIGEDDELDDLDVFDADDDVFDDAMDGGESHAEFAASGMGRVEVAAQEADWGGGMFAGLLVSTGLMALCSMLMFDLVRGMWAWNEPSAFNSVILEALSGLFG
jgi:hypothetical protein